MAGLFVSSCSDYLDVVPDNVPTLDHAFANRHACEGYLFTCYSYLPAMGDFIETPDFQGADEFYFGEMTTVKNGLDRKMWGLTFGLQNKTNPIGNTWDGQYEEQSNQFGKVWFGQPLYKAIRDCNIFLENVNRPYDLEEYERKRWVAEVKFLKELSKACEEVDAVLVLDEIQSGYGRSGKFFAHQHAGIRPDMITVAKGVGNGFPMAGVLISPKFKPVYGQLGTTFGGNHLACAAAIAVLDVIKGENLVENAAKVGAHLLKELKQFPQIKEVRGEGLMIGMEFDEPIKELRQRLLFEQKVFTGVSGTNVIRLLPPLCLTMAEADEFIERFRKVLV